MKRETTYVDLRCEVNDINITDSDAFLTHLHRRAHQDDIILAHALDGVIWGCFDGGRFYFSHEVAPDISPPLRLETLGQLRLFDATREVYFWHDGDHWHERTVIEGEGTATPVITERHVLWGTRGIPLKNGFTLLEDGSQGLRHVVPIDATHINERHVRPCLWVCHVLNESPSSVASTITYSRLAGLEVMETW
jgi:CRISPR-associated protein (TIGR03984 family)